MASERVDLEFDEQYQFAILRIGVHQPREAIISLPRGFGPDDVREAIVATGKVRPVRDSYQLIVWIRAEQLADMVTSMIGMFEAPGVPGQELLQVRSAVDDYLEGESQEVSIPWMAIAWLAASVAEDVADEARTSTKLWEQPRLTIDCEKIRARRIRELLGRATKEIPARRRRVSPSSPTLEPTRSIETRTG